MADSDTDDVRFAPINRDAEIQRQISRDDDQEVTLCTDKLGCKERVEEHSNDNPGLVDDDQPEKEEEVGEDLPPNIRRDRPFSASMVSSKSGVSKTSRASLSTSIMTSEFASKNMFAYRDGTFEKAVEDCRRSVIVGDSDGEFQGAWLLTEIDHWDYEREKLLILTDSSLLIVKYDFIKLAARDAKHIPLSEIINLQVGDLVYPPKSLMTSRNYGGVRIHFGEYCKPSFPQRWNPWSKQIPYVTLTHHLLVYNKNETETVTYNADDFAESLVRSVKVAHDGAGLVEKFRISECPIVVESYASVSSIIHNQSKLGFNLERGGVSF